MDPNEDSSRPPRSRARWHAVVGVAIAALLVFAMATAAGGLRDSVRQLRRADTRLLWFVLALQAVRFTAFGEQLRTISGRPRQRRWVTLRVSTVMFGLGNVLPASPAEGIAMSSAELHRRGLTGHLAVLMLLLSQWLQFWALMLLFVVDQVVVHANGELPGRLGRRVTLLGVAVLVVTIVAIRQSRKRDNAVRVALLLRKLPGRYRRTRRDATAAGLQWFDDVNLLLGSNANRLRASVLATVGWVADGCGLWLTLRAVQAHVSLEVVLLGYVVATLVSWVPLLPGGVGAVEAALPALLHHFGVPLVVGLAGTLLWRGASLFLPALVGLLGYLSLRAGAPGAVDPDTALAGAERELEEP